MSLRRQSFTLLEMVIVSTILVSVLSLVFLGSSSVFQSWEQITVQNGRFQKMVVLDQTLKNVFRGAVTFDWPDEAGAATPTFSGTRSEVTLCYRHAPTSDGALRFCTIMCEDGKLLLNHDSRPIAADLFANQSILHHSTAKLEITYIGLEDEQLSHQEEWKDLDYLPLAVQLNITFLDESKQSWLIRLGGKSFHSYPRPQRQAPRIIQR